MKILLMPPIGGGYFASESPCLGLGYLATSLIRAGHEVRLLIKETKKMSPVKFRAVLKDYKPELLGITVVSCALKSAIETARLVKSVNPAISTIIGGPHPSSETPENIFRDIPLIDYAFEGEAELSLVEFASQLFQAEANNIATPETIPGLIYRQGDKILKNPCKFENDLDSLGFPAWDLMPPSDFPQGTVDAFSKAAPVASVILTRGCPFKCTFCTPMNGYKVRTRSVANVMEELRMLYHDFRVKEFQFIDSNISASRELLIGVCREIVESNLKIHWCCPNGIRLGNLDEELMAWMKRSGCYEVNVGIESGSPKILKKIKKAITLDLVREKISLLDRIGIDVVGLFIFGFPGETREDMEKTFMLAQRKEFFRGQFFIFTPLPGTEIYRELLRNGKICSPDWSKMDYYYYENHFSELSPSELRFFVKKVFWTIHLHPSRIFRILRRINCWRNLQMVLRYAWYRLIQ